MKGLDWSNERWEKLYCRDTVAWLRLSQEAQSVYLALLRKLDRAGTLPLDGEEPHVAVAVLLGWDEGWVEAGLARLLEHGWLLVDEPADLLVDPEWIERDEAPQSSQQRKRESRARRRERAAAAKKLGPVPGGHEVAEPHTGRPAAVTIRDPGGTERDDGGTTGHTATRDVTPNPTRPDIPTLPTIPTTPPRSVGEMAVEEVGEIYATAGLEAPTAGAIRRWLRLCPDHPEAVIAVLRTLAEREDLGRGESYVTATLRRVAAGEELHTDPAPAASTTRSPGRRGRISAIAQRSRRRA